jgi:predicted TIM-barrel fold metal-dependent hydrolase
MAIPDGLGIIDTMIGFPHPDMAETYRFITDQVRDRESKEDFVMPAQYLFGDIPEAGLTDVEDPVALTLSEMDRYGVAVGVVGIGDGIGDRAVAEHPDRFVGQVNVDPTDPVAAVRSIRDAVATHGVTSVGWFPAGCNPPIPINDKKAYPVYATCVELGLPIFVCAGVPGPRLPFASQHVELIDEVCYDFPELVFVTRHGCEPWVDLVVKLLLKWPNLYYSTSAFAPKHYPGAILDYARTRGADKVLYGGYFPMGLSLERLTRELGELTLPDEVLAKVARHNAARVLGIEG